VIVIVSLEIGFDSRQRYKLEEAQQNNEEQNKLIKKLFPGQSILFSVIRYHTKQ
jgi:hypothetical protein